MPSVVTRTALTEITPLSTVITRNAEGYVEETVSSYGLFRHVITYTLDPDGEVVSAAHVLSDL